MVKRYDLTYLIIPELHKDGAIHMHGIISGRMTLFPATNPHTGESLKTKRGQQIYNMPQWLLGHSTAIELDGNTQAISRYITKYISKDFRKIFGNFYYAGGHELERCPQTSLYDTNYHEVNAKEYTQHGTGYKYMQLGDYMDFDSADANVQAILEMLGVS